MTKMNNPKFTTPSGDTAPRQVWQQTVDAVLAQTKSQAAGLSSADAAERLNTCGPNALPEKKGKPGWLRFLAHFNDVLIYVLLAAAALTAIMGHWVDTLVILGVTVINALIGHIQESNAEKSLQGIRNMLSSDARVQRNGKHETIPTRDLVPGDIVILRAGDRVPADMRLIETHNLRVEEAILTGESTVVDKITDALEGDLPLGDRVNMVFSGTTVSAGGGVGVVTATGAQTELGHINQMMAGIEKHRTPLLVQMDKLGKAIFAIILAMMVALFIFSLALRDIPMGELLLSLISLAVAAVPEGLPAIISIILSLGVQTMARKRAIIRKLPTVETLGAMTVVCSDKTGTLTMNEMTVKAIITADCCYRVEGDSYEPQGRIFLEGSDEPVQVQPGTVLETWLRTIDLCNDSQLTQDERGLWGITGGPTEGALKVLAAKAQLPAVEARLVAKIPFDSQYKYMSTLQHIDGNARVLITGAPDVIFAMCREQMSRHGAVPFEAQYWEEEMARFARQGLRMVAAACKPASLDATTLNHEDLQEGLIFLGIAGMMDPPRPEAIDAIHACQTAGIRVKMITGDHPQTAMSIGQMLGITNSSQAMTGYKLEHMDDAALRQADVGIAMGIKGTEVTKEAADMVLTDDNFATIASSVKEGRRVYDNLKKTILFIMPTNLAQGLLIIIALLAGNIIPLTPVLILWMNMATSATLSFGLAFEAAERNVMNRPPRKTGQHVMDGFAVWRVAFVGSMIAIAAFILEAWLAPRGHSPEFIRTVLLQMLVTAQWVYMINCRSSDSFSLSMGLLRNKGIWLVTGVLLLMQLVIIYVPLMQSMFGTEALPLRYWFVTLVIGVAMFLVVEVEKRLTRRFRKTA
ncbi:TPA: HAD-IC family P-type ATPase [Klebsiella pneumoniae]|uniref:HAD-IC family P-type ATPase n=1 Tax=Klebsiella pneumoniae TaxID=573 RepID=UPI000651FC7B|nr:HAD-IC family P-type ATPase [Klebsiella pneumoniae]KMG60506.1 potassium/sodium efflux P-type ATPase, fungal-type [Klebsiella pneumoniae]HBR6144891.1 HAD-IC family P-type ATPase [Klebsiella pneumoniae]HBR6195058.1 HAD-IC family P-type ATPase [Klebsiella pneumoniae]HBT3972092.1 HAD-IC family P-type ATPase [Klebsiella pneumoniae]HDZ0373579.1 HAD-IC family P-type ATPase [Klebsiella pneumoniae]